MKNEDKFKESDSETNLANIIDDEHKHLKTDVTADITYHSVIISKNTGTFEMYKGFLFMFISCLFRTSATVLGKYILETKKDLTSFQLNAYVGFYLMSISIFIFVLFLIGLIELEIKNKKNIYYVAGRSFMAITVETFIVLALRFLPASNVYSVFFLYPGLVMILSSMILKENFSFLDFLCFPICFVGVILVIKPKIFFSNDELNIHVKNSDGKNLINNSNSHESHDILYLLVFLACFAKGTGDFIVRKVKDISPFIIPMGMSIVGIIILPILVMIDHTKIPEIILKDHILFFINAFLIFFYQFFLASSLQNDNAGRVVMINYVQLVFLFIADIFVFNKKFEWLNFLGIMIIFTINVANAIYKTIKRIDTRNNLNEEINLNDDINNDGVEKNKELFTTQIDENNSKTKLNKEE